MEVERISPKKIKIAALFKISQQELFEIITEPYKMGLWLADSVRKTPKGFDLEINLLMHVVKNQATILEKKAPIRFEFLWNSEYVMDQSIVSFELQKGEDGTNLTITETGDFDGSRWSDPQEIHLKLWSKALERLEKVI